MINVTGVRLDRTTASPAGLNAAVREDDLDKPFCPSCLSGQGKRREKLQTGLTSTRLAPSRGAAAVEARSLPWHHIVPYLALAAYARQRSVPSVARTVERVSNEQMIAPQQRNRPKLFCLRQCAPGTSQLGVRDVRALYLTMTTAVGSSHAGCQHMMRGGSSALEPLGCTATSRIAVEGF